MKPKRAGIALVTIGLITIAICFIALIGSVIQSVRKPVIQFEKTALSMVGKPEADLIKALGEPMHTIHAATLEGRTVDYPWKGMNYVPVPDYPVRGKVLLYAKLDIAIYAYVDANGIIEHVAVGRT